MKIASRCREQARRVYHGAVFQAKKEIPLDSSTVFGRGTKVSLFILQVVIPTLVGAAIYTLWGTRTLLVFKWYNAFGLTRTVAYLRTVAGPRSALPSVVIFSLPDALWVYALTATMCCIWWDIDGLGKRIWICAGVLLGVAGELGQLFGLVPGTFDPLDLLACVVAGVSAVCTHKLFTSSKDIWMSKLRANCLSLIAIGIFAVLATGSMDSPSDTPNNSASKPSTETQAPQTPSTAVTSCDPRISEATSSRYMRAHDYRDMAHELHGWSGGVWMAVGENCSILSIQTADQWPDESKAAIKSGLIGRDLCSHGFVAVTFNGFPPEPLDCSKPHAKRRTK